MKRFWSSSQVAEHLGCTREAVRLMVGRGELQAVASVHDGRGRNYRLFDPTAVRVFHKKRRQTIPARATGKKT